MQEVTPPPSPWGPSPPAPGEISSHRLSYAGRTSTLFGIHFVNLALDVLTLWIYRFWARTRIRRFLWSATRIDDEPFEYAGTGSEIFFGFLRVVAILLPVVVVAQLIPLALDQDIESVAMATETIRFSGIVYLIFTGSYFARRYRMSRTLWRGIRFQQIGSAWRYGALRLAHLILVGLTLGIYFPWYQIAVTRYETANLRFGNARFAFNGRGGDLIWPFIGTGILAVFLALAVFFAAIAIGAFAGFYAPKPSSALRIDGRLLTIGAGIAATVLLFIVLYLAFLWYKARFYRYVAERTSFESLRFEATTLTGGRLIRLVVGNLLIMVLSIGTLAPLTIQRSMRFWCRHLRLVGTVDLAAIAQGERGPRVGEGLAGFFDLDLG